MKLDWKLVSAFAIGALLACGIVYFSVKPAAIAPEPLRPVPAPAKPEAPKREIAAQPKTPPAPVPAKHAAEPIHVPIREKPSPMPPPVRHEQQVVARYQPPPAPVAAAPAPVAPLPPAPRPVENVPAQNVSLPVQQTAQPKPQAPVAPSVTLTAGSLLFVRLGQTLSSELNALGDSFFATLTQPLVVDGWVIAERGARVEGRVVDMNKSRLEISLVRVALSDHQQVSIHTEGYARDGAAAFGIFGRKPAEIPADSRLTFRVLDPITITERVN